MALPNSLCDREQGKFFEDPAGNTSVNSAENVNFEERKDENDPSSVFTGKTATLGASQTSAVWQIKRDAISGGQTHTSYALNNAGYIHKWSDRNNGILFPPVPFFNKFSLQLGGSPNQHGVVTNTANLDFDRLDAFSLGMWFKTSSNLDGTYFDKLATSGYVLDFNGGGTPGFRMRDDVGGRLDIDIDPPGALDVRDGAWHLIIVTKDNTGLAGSDGIIFYVDNVPYKSSLLNVDIANDGLTGSTLNAGDLTIGAANDGLTQLDGNIDSVAVWNAELTALEAAEIWGGNNGVIDLKSASGQISSALVSWWRMGDGTFSAIPNIPDEESGFTMVTQAGINPGDIETEVPP